MEIKDFLTKRNLLILIGVPVLAGLIASSVVFLSPTKYSATATVNPLALVGGADGQYTGSQAVNQFVSAFQATASSAPVDQRVYADAKVKPGAITDGLMVAQVGGSSAVTVSFESVTKGQPTAAVTAVADETLKQMFSSQVELSQQSAKGAQQQVSDANNAIKAWGEKNGVVDPQQAYQSQLDRLNSLLQQQASLKAQGNSAGASALSGTISSVNGDLKKYSGLIAAFSDLTANRDSAVAALTAAQTGVSKAQTQLAASEATGVVSVGSERPVNRGDEIVTVVLPAVGAGLFLAVGLILLLELVGSRKRSGRTATARDGAAPATEPVEPVESVDVVEPVEAPASGARPESVSVRS